MNFSMFFFSLLKTMKNMHLIYATVVSPLLCIQSLRINVIIKCFVNLEVNCYHKETLNRHYTWKFSFFLSLPVTNMTKLDRIIPLEFNQFIT